MLSLDEDFDETRFLEPMQVNACGRWAHTSDDGEFGAGPRVAVHEAVEDARTRRLANGRSDSGGCGVRVMGDIHTLRLNEVCPSDN